MSKPDNGNAPLKVGVVGVGYLGQHHARVYSEMGGVELVGVTDTDEGRVREIAGRFNTEFYTDYRKLIPQLDAVNIVSPTVTHHEIGRFCLETGADVFVEKPITATIPEAEDLVKLALKGGRILQVGHIERFNGAVRELARLVENPGFIEAHRLGSFVGRATDVDVVLDLMIHDIDIILSLVNSPVRDIRANGVPVITPNVDIANARIEFENGCVANVTASRVSTNPQRKTRFFQPDTYIALDFQAQKIDCYRRIGNPEDFLRGEPPQIVQEKVAISKEEPLKVELESFVHAVRSRSRPVVSGAEGLKALQVATSIIQAIQASTQAIG
jgi:predicted dehydrogenase